MRLLLLLLLAGLTVSCSRTYYYVVRHGEKANIEKGPSSHNPPLSSAGKVRAIVLRDELKDKRITHIFSTNTIRTITTVDPLSEETGVPVQLYNTVDSLDFFIDKVKMIRKGNVLIAGHSNTINDVVNRLCGKTMVAGDLPETEHDNLFIVRLKGDKAKLTIKKYGYPSNPEH